MLRLTALSVVTLAGGCAVRHPVPLASDDVTAAGKLVARYEHRDYDAANVRATCKVWHDVFAPDGRLLTKGLGGEFEHHRGLFVGWNQVRAGEQTLDFWHCRRGESQRHAGFADPDDLGLDGDWQVARVHWCNAAGQTVVHELRAMRARTLSADSVVLDVTIELAAAASAVELAGDPQHSGHQFRALDDFAVKNAEKVRYVRPQSASALGDDVWVECGWIAAVLPLPKGPVTVVRVEAEGNPTPVRWSTRDYGRFGATFAHRLLPGAPLRVRYHYVIALGERDAAACARLANMAAAN